MKQLRWEGSVREFIVRHYTPYDGDDTFLCPSTDATQALWNKVSALLNEERARGGVYDIDTSVISGIDTYKEGYIDRELERIVGLQTDTPLVRAVMPFGGDRKSTRLNSSH